MYVDVFEIISVCSTAAKQHVMCAVSLVSYLFVSDGLAGLLTTKKRIFTHWAIPFVYLRFGMGIPILGCIKLFSDVLKVTKNPMFPDPLLKL